MIRNIEQLAERLGTSVENLKNDVHEYTDYDTHISWDSHSVTLITVVPEANESLEKSLVFPFTQEAFDDAISGLQCWADYTFCSAYYGRR